MMERTFSEWNAMGYRINRGAKAIRFINGESVFTQEQVWVPSAQKVMAYDNGQCPHDLTPIQLVLDDYDEIMAQEAVDRDKRNEEAWERAIAEATEEDNQVDNTSIAFDGRFTLKPLLNGFFEVTEHIMCGVTKWRPARCQDIGNPNPELFYSLKWVMPDHNYYGKGHPAPHRYDAPHFFVNFPNDPDFPHTCVWVHEKGTP